MFIDRRVKPERAPDRGARCGSLAETTIEPHSVPTERWHSFGCDIYKHFVAFVPMGLVVLVSCVLFLAFARDSSVSASRLCLGVDGKADRASAHGWRCCGRT